MLTLIMTSMMTIIVTMTTRGRSSSDACNTLPDITTNLGRHHWHILSSISQRNLVCYTIRRDILNTKKI